MPVSLDKAVIARLKYSGERFEILVDPEGARRIKEKLHRGEKVSYEEVAEILAAEEVFRDSKKGERVPENELVKIFRTDNIYEIALKIIDSGEVQLTSEQRKKMIEEKKKQIITIISRKAVDPRTGTPIPPQRIEAAMEEVRVNIDPFKPAEMQVKEVLNEIRKIIPIRLEVAKVEIRIPPEYVGKAYSIVQRYATIIKENWLSDGSWEFTAEVPAGLVTEFFEKLAQLTKGNVQTAILERHE
ncbi:MAG: ribosome assembly factor SBDS [Euryarchaeota archaeon]|nr:ribosome assembly factor SBDS [Euryarchaeota archaeon]